MSMKFKLAIVLACSAMALAVGVGTGSAYRLPPTHVGAHVCNFDCPPTIPGR